MERNPESSTARTQRYIRYLLGGVLTLGVFQVITYAYVRVQMAVSADSNESSASKAAVAASTAATESADAAAFVSAVTAAASDAATGASDALASASGAVSSASAAVASAVTGRPEPAPAVVKRRVVPRFALARPWEVVYVRARASDASADM